MRIVDFREHTIGEAILFISQMEPQHISNSASTMTQEQLGAVIEHINDLPDLVCQEKTHAVVAGTHHRSRLEIIGRALSVSQLLGLLGTRLLEEKQIWKLTPILVGLPHPAFSRVLAGASPEQLLLLQNEGVTEPLQHHLTLLGHELQTQIDQILSEIDLYRKNLNSIDPPSLNLKQVESLFYLVDDYALAFKQSLDLAIKSLGIAWNTRRVDLIDTFSKVKNDCQKILSLEIGVPRLTHSPPSGLYATTEAALFSIYGNPADSSQIDALRDDEPVVEAMVKFSIWYLRDYWEMGLLPNIKKKDDLDLDVEKYSEAERTSFRQNLFTLVQQRLEKIGLSTVLDLKAARIFSKKTLEEYIQRSNEQQTKSAEKEYPDFAPHSK